MPNAVVSLRDFLRHPAEKTTDVVFFVSGCGFCGSRFLLRVPKA